MTTIDSNEPAPAATAPLKIDDLLNITIKGARVMYAIPDTSEGGPRLTTVKHAGVHYVLIAEPGTVTISKVEDDAPSETTTAPAQTRVSDDRVQEILDGLNGFVSREYDGGTHLVNGAAVPCATVVGCDANVDKAIEWAEEQIVLGGDIANVFGPDTDGSAEVELADGTVIKWFPTPKQWAVTVSDDVEAVAA